VHEAVRNVGTNAGAIHARLRERAAEELLESNYTVLRVEERAAENFVLLPGERESQVVAHSVRLVQHRALQPEAVLKDAQRKSNHLIISRVLARRTRAATGSPPHGPQ
jgi:hypothetical protein